MIATNSFSLGGAFQTKILSFFVTVLTVRSIVEGLIFSHLNDGLEIALLGSDLEVDLQQRSGSGSISHIRLTDPGKGPGETLITLPVSLSLDAFFTAVDATPADPQPRNDLGFYDLLMPGNSPFPDLFFTGHSGRDIGHGFDGDDVFDMGGGRDTLFGSLGSDVFRGGAGRDTFDGRFLQAPLDVNLGNGTASFGVNSVSLVEVENVTGTADDDILIGNGQRNTILGRDGDDVLNGLGGKDYIDGGAGRDDINGGRGDDTLLGAGGNDTIKGGAGDDRIDGEGGQDNINGGAGDDRIDGGGHSDRLNGGSGRDSILGGSGRDRIDGGSGRDTLDGGRGNDRLTGGSGADRFVFDDSNGARNGTDTITDYTAGSDEIHIDGGRLRDILIAQTEGNTIIDYDEGRIILENVTLDKSDIGFIF